MRWFIKALKIKVPEILQEEATYKGKKYLRKSGLDNGKDHMIKTS